MKHKRRQMIFAPEINQSSFVFFFQKGSDGTSWSIRDYSIQDQVTRPRYAQDFGFSLDELRSKVVHAMDAPIHPTTDLGFWHEYTLNLNRTYLSNQSYAKAGQASRYVTVPTPPPRDRVPESAFPIVDRKQFDQHAKSRKPNDRRRMEFSGASEDWVTWTVFRLLEKDAPGSWWPDFVSHANAYNPRLELPPCWREPPELRLWESLPSPVGYERASRDRMRRSNNPTWMARSEISKPVEGNSEIDITLRNGALIVFVEAKLGSDISPYTTYDPQRNQIVRNIDCLLDQLGDRVPMFWVLVRDAGQDRSYTRLLDHYRDHPDALVRQLPHHDATRVVQTAENLSLVLWRDIAAKALDVSSGDDAEVESIRTELRRRI